MLDRHSVAPTFLCTAVACALLLVSLPSLAHGEEPAATYEHPVLISVEGFIGPWLQHYVQRKLQQAKEQQCDLLILEIDSPGGGLTETLEICEQIQELEGVHTVAYVPREALSGAAIIALACDDIVLSDMARIGDCGAIEWMEGIGFQHVPEKFRSDLIARVRSIAQQNDHAPALAEAMVDTTVQVIRVRLPNGTEQLVTDRELNRANAEQWEKLETLPESGGGRFLELLGVRAKEVGLAVALADTREAVGKQYALARKPAVLEPTVIDTTVFVLNHPLMTGVLLVVGFVALLYEFSAPGIGVGGLTAGLCFALFFWSRFLGGTSGWLEVLLFAAGLVFLAVELFLIPGFGITGIAGIMLLLASVVLASQEFALPRTNAEIATTTTSTLTALLAAAACVVVCAVALRNMGSIPVLNRLMLGPPATKHSEIKTADGKTLASVENNLSVGDWGVATTLLRPGGKAQFGDQIVDVVANGGFFQPGVQVQIVELQGTRIVVEKVT